MALEKNPYQVAKEYALRRVNRRECTSADVLKYLIKKNTDPEIASNVVNELISSNQINDERYTSLLVRHQMRQAKGPHVIRQKLRNQGIGIDVAKVSQLIEEHSEQTELETAKQWVERKYPSLAHLSELPVAEKQKQSSRAIQGLVRRGFSYSVAYDAVFDKSRRT